MRILIALAKVHKIKRLTRVEFDKLSAPDQKAYLNEYPHSSFKDAELNFNNVKLDVKTELNAISKHFKVSNEELKSALSQRDVARVLKHGVKSTVHALESIFSFANTVAKSTFEEIAKTKAVKKLQNGTMKVDEFLKKYPKIRKMGGPVIAGALVYQWMNMSFSGDFDEDFDVSSIGKALEGEYSVHDLLSSPSGLKSMAQLAAGIATGGLLSFPWHGSLNIAFAAAYTGAKKLKNTKLTDKLKFRVSREDNRFVYA